MVREHLFKTSLRCIDFDGVLRADGEYEFLHARDSNALDAQREGEAPSEPWVWGRIPHGKVARRVSEGESFLSYPLADASGYLALVPRLCD